MLPNFLVIGAPRAGTTYIFKNIELHPNIFMPNPKEIHFFDRSYDRGISFYEKYFKKANGCAAIGEATPAYLHTGQVASRIKTHLPDAKLIVCLRNPVDRLYSRFWNAKAKFSSNKKLSFEEKIKFKPEFIEEGFYDIHLQRYFLLFPKENFLILFFDDMIRNPALFLQKIYNFLQVDTTFLSPIMDKNVNAASAKKFLAKNLYVYYLQKLIAATGLKGISEKINEVNKTVIPKMLPQTRQWLINDIYAVHNNNLEKLLDIDLSAWNK